MDKIIFVFGSVRVVYNVKSGKWNIDGKRKYYTQFLQDFSAVRLTAENVYRNVLLNL